MRADPKKNCNGCANLTEKRCLTMREPPRERFCYKTFEDAIQTEYDLVNYAKSTNPESGISTHKANYKKRIKELEEINGRQELSQCYWLNRKIEQLKRELEELEGSEIKPINLTGMPSGGGTSDHVAKIAIERAEVSRLIQLKTEECATERARIERYIDTVGSERMQDILRLRHINGLTWRQIAQELGGSERHVKRLYYDFLKNT